MKVFEEVIGNDANASIFRANINPLRLGLQLYKLIDEIAGSFGYSQYCCQQMKDDIEEQMAKVLESFSDIEDIINLLKLPDFEGRDCFWYLQQFPLFSVLEVKIMDKFIR